MNMNSDMIWKSKFITGGDDNIEQFILHQQGQTNTK